MPIGIVIVLGILIAAAKLFIMQVVHDRLVPAIVAESNWNYLDALLPTGCRCVSGSAARPSGGSVCRVGLLQNTKRQTLLLLYSNQFDWTVCTWHGADSAFAPGVAGTCLFGEFVLIYVVSYCKNSVLDRLNSCKFNFV